MSSPARQAPECLRVGFTAKTTLHITKQWNEYNRSLGKSIHRARSTREKEKTELMSVCSTAPVRQWKWYEADCCRAHLTTRKVMVDGVQRTEVVSVDLNHTCPDVSRKRKSQEELMLEFKVPAKKLISEGKVYATKSKEAGVTYGSTDKMYRELSKLRKERHEKEIGQYMLLPSVFQTLQKQDTNGTYILENGFAFWDKSRPRRPQFRRCYVVLSTMKHCWKESKVNCIQSDATLWTGGSFNHNIVLALMYDGENRPLILAFAAFDTKKKGDWIWFCDYLYYDFPGVQIFVADADDGTVKDLQTNAPDGCRIARSVRSLGNECIKKFSKDSSKMPEPGDFLGLAECRTQQQYYKYLQKFATTNAAVGEWLDSRKERFTTYGLLGLQAKCKREEPGREVSYARFGHLSSNVAAVVAHSAEQNATCPLDDILVDIHDAFNEDNRGGGSISELKEKPILDMVLQLINWIVGCHLLRKQEAAASLTGGQELTQYSRHRQAKFMEDASKCRVEILSSANNLHQAKVTRSGNSDDHDTEVFTVEIDSDSSMTKCSCLQIEEFGDPCEHVIAVILKLAMGPADRKNWFHPRYHVENLCAMYQADRPLLSLAGCLFVSNWLPIEHKNRELHKEIYNSTKRKPKKPCTLCGATDHWDASCVTPSTEYRVGLNDYNANRWACQQCILAKGVETDSESK